MEIEKALQELRNEKKRKFVQTLDLIINLKNYDVRKEALNIFIALPHVWERKIGAFLTKKSNVVDTITENDFAKYKETKDMKKLAKKYDLFMASAPMMSKVATKFGRVFGPMGKMPSPQAGIVTKEDDETIKNVLEQIKKKIRIRNKEKSIKIPIGKDNMSDEELKENIESAIEAIEQKLPRGKENIKNIMIKFTMTKPIKIRE